ASRCSWTTRSGCSPTRCRRTAPTCGRHWRWPSRMERIQSVRAKAAVHLRAGRPLEVVEIDMADPGPDDVVVRMQAVGICGTDLHLVKGEWRRPTPMVLGHEGAGVIEAVGRNVDPARVGEEVVLTWAASCQACADCRRGRPAACAALHRAMAAGTLVDGTTGMSLGGKPVYRGTATGALV